jgi:hypothetical protein
MTDNLFGPRLGATILKDMFSDISVDPQMENQLLLDGFVAPVHPSDDIKTHIPAHQQAMQQSGDPHGTIRVHIMAHMNALQAAQQAQQQQMMAQQMQQGGGGRGARMGATPGMPRGGQNPPGAIHQDRMIDPGKMPR